MVVYLHDWLRKFFEKLKSICMFQFGAADLV